MGDPQGAPYTQSSMMLTWSPEAIDDLHSLRTQISVDDPAAAKRVALHILHCVEELLPANPQLGHPGARNTRTRHSENALRCPLSSKQYHTGNPARLSPGRNNCSARPIASLASPVIMRPRRALNPGPCPIRQRRAIVSPWTRLPRARPSQSALRWWHKCLQVKTVHNTSPSDANIWNDSRSRRAWRLPVRHPVVLD
jgi:hypothetical protein